MTPDAFEKIVNDLRIIGTDKQGVEVKSNVGKDIRNTLSAFSNGTGGLIIVGLSEKDGFTTVPKFDVSRAQDQLETRCQELTPPVRPHTDIFTFEGSSVLLAMVPELTALDRPCYITEQGRYQGSYIRTGDGDTHLTKYEVDKLLEEHIQPHWDETPVEGATVEALDRDILDEFLSQQQSRRPKTLADGEDIACERLRITTGENLTLAALMTMGEYPQEYYPRLHATFALFPGVTRSDVTNGQRLLDSQRIDGTIPEIVTEGVRLVERNMRTGALIKDIYRTDMPDYPLVAVREALVNALMHRDYSPTALGAPVQISMFQDRLEISNPGGLYAVSLETLGSPGASSTRNPRLATFLEDIPFPGGGTVAENRGTGIATMNNAMAEALLPPPKYTPTISRFTVTFFRRRVAPQERYATAQERVHAELAQRTTASTTELTAATQLSRTSVQNAINQLISSGAVERTEPLRSPKQRYRLTEK